MKNPFDLTLSEALSHPDPLVRRHANGVLKALVKPKELPVVQLEEEKEKEMHEYSCDCNEGGKTENHVFWTIDDYKDSGTPVCPFCDCDMYKI